MRPTLRSTLSSRATNGFSTARNGGRPAPAIRAIEEPLRCDAGLEDYDREAPACDAIGEPIDAGRINGDLAQGRYRVGAPAVSLDDIKARDFAKVCNTFSNIKKHKEEEVGQN